MVQSYFATCARGLEPLLAEELKSLHAIDIGLGRGGVQFRGNRALLYRTNLQLRTAIRVLLPIMDAEVRTTDELYDTIRAIDWSKYLTPDHTLAVDCNVRDSQITHSQYAARRVKDAICDQFREATGRRPDVNPDRPMIGLNLHIFKNKATLSLDSSGDSLHKRGYRPVQTIAPLNEALAAGLILRTGWRGQHAFADPMCGGGTFCIEAAWIALNRPPGLTRKHFGFMGWMDYDVGLFAAIRDDLRQHVAKSLKAPVVGADQRRDVIEFAKANAKAAGVGHVVNWAVMQLHEWEPPAANGTLICNPPYGERIGDEKELRGFYRQMGQIFRDRCAGWNVWVFTGNALLANEIGTEPIESLPFFNGKIPCQFLRFQI